MSQVVMWDKPERVISKEDWKAISADSAPPGVYTSNMSDEDMGRWKSKVVGATLGSPQIELRKVFSGSYKKLPGERWGSGFCANMLVIVATKGFQYKGVKREESVDYNVYISMNAGAAMTFVEYEEMQQAIQEAKDKLAELQGQVATKKAPKKRKG